MIDSQLLQKSLPFIKRMAYSASKRIGCSVDAEDIAQDICLALISSQRMVTQDNIKTRVYDAAQDIIRKHARRYAKCQFTPLQDAPREQDMTAIDVNTFLQSLEGKERITAFLLIAGISIKQARRNGYRIERPLQRIREKWCRCYA